MTFEFDQPRSAATNQHAADTHCPTCQGHRLVPIPDPDREVYARCPDCNPAPTKTREPVDVDGWWKNR